MRPEFGCAVHDYVFAPADASTAGDIAYAVRRRAGPVGAAHRRWSTSSSRFDAVDHGMLYIDVQLLPARHQRPAQPGLPVLPDPAGTTEAGVVMTLPAPNLDDRRFQDLVDDAKRMVQQRCPEWTDHNVSDPGVTLIETFAFMVDQLLYRLNRVPDRLYVTFLDLHRRDAAPADRRAAPT